MLHEQRAAGACVAVCFGAIEFWGNTCYMNSVLQVRVVVCFGASVCWGNTCCMNSVLQVRVWLCVLCASVFWGNTCYMNSVLQMCKVHSVCLSTCVHKSVNV